MSDSMSNDIDADDVNPELDGIEAAAETDSSDQWTQSDTLVNRGVADVLDEGYTTAENWSPAQGFGNTAAEQAQGETLDQRLAQEVPEEDPRKLKGSWNPNDEPREVGTRRAGRLISTTDGFSADSEKDVVAEDVGISGGAASAEEAAMHIIDTNDSGDDDEDVIEDLSYDRDRRAGVSRDELDETSQSQRG